MPTLPASYTTVELVYQLAPTVGSVSNVTSAHIADMIGMADAEINAVLSKRYTVPITDDCPVLTTISTNLTTYYTLRRLYTREKQNKSDWVDGYKERATSLLEKLMDGEIGLVTSSGAVVAAADVAEVWSNTKDYVPTFSELDYTQSVIDDDKLDDLEDERD